MYALVGPFRIQGPPHEIWSGFLSLVLASSKQAVLKKLFSLDSSQEKTYLDLKKKRIHVSTSSRRRSFLYSLYIFRPCHSFVTPLALLRKQTVKVSILSLHCFNCRLSYHKSDITLLFKKQKKYNRIVLVFWPLDERKTAQYGIKSYLTWVFFRVSWGLRIEVFSFKSDTFFRFVCFL